MLKKNKKTFTNTSPETVKIHVFGSCGKKLDYTRIGKVIAPSCERVCVCVCVCVCEWGCAVFSSGQAFSFVSSDRKLQ